MSKGLWGTLWPDSQTLTPHSHLSRPRGAKSTHFHSSKNMCPTPQYLAQEGEMGAPGGGLKQCAQGWGQDRTSVGSPHMPKATFPFVTARQWVDGWRLFFLNTATVSGGHSSPWRGYSTVLIALRSPSTDNHSRTQSPHSSPRANARAQVGGARRPVAGRPDGRLDGVCH